MNFKWFCLIRRGHRWREELVPFTPGLGGIDYRCVDCGELRADSCSALFPVRPYVSDLLDSSVIPHEGDGPVSLFIRPTVSGRFDATKPNTP